MIISCCVYSVFVFVNDYVFFVNGQNNLSFLKVHFALQILAGAAIMLFDHHLEKYIMGFTSK